MLQMNLNIARFGLPKARVALLGQDLGVFANFNCLCQESGQSKWPVGRHLES